MYLAVVGSPSEESKVSGWHIVVLREESVMAWRLTMETMHLMQRVRHSVSIAILAPLTLMPKC